MDAWRNGVSVCGIQRVKAVEISEQSASLAVAIFVLRARSMVIGFKAIGKFCFGSCV